LERRKKKEDRRKKKEDRRKRKRKKESFEKEERERRKKGERGERKEKESEYGLEKLSFFLSKTQKFFNLQVFWGRTGTNCRFSNNLFPSS